MARTTVALFGGSFNPPHVGHVLAATYVLSVGLVDRVLVVPVYEHALRKHLAPFEHRLEMSRLAFAGLARVEVSAIEGRLGAPSRTLSTLVALEAEHPDWDLRLMVGSDILGEIGKWHAFDEIARRAPLLVLPRAGSPAPGAVPALPPATLPQASLPPAALPQASLPPAALPQAALPQAALPPCLLPEVSSTEVRALLGRAAGGTAPELGWLVPRGVLRYLREHALYDAP